MNTVIYHWTTFGGRFSYTLTARVICTFDDTVVVDVIAANCPRPMIGTRLWLSQREVTHQ